MTNQVEPLAPRRAKTKPSTALIEAAPAERAPVPANEAAAIIQMIERAAANPAVDVDKFARLLEMREKVEADFARKAFNAAIAQAKGAIGPIVKDRAVDFSTQKGRTNYRFEGFDSIARAVDPILNKHGLSYRFRATQASGRVCVTCILSHRDGYSEETTLEVAEDHSGNKNAIQAIGSSTTYLQRYTLKLALGLATTLDDDGRGGPDPAPPRISDEQRDRLIQRIAEVGADPVAFLEFCGVARLDDLPPGEFPKAMAALDAKARKRSQ